MQSLFSTRARKGQMLKRERERLVKLVREYVLANGGRYTPEEEIVLSYRVELPTLAGLLRIAVDGGNIFCRFDDAKTAAHVLALVGVKTSRLNPHSGKWNWHFGRQTAREAFEAFARELEPLLRPRVGPLKVVLAKKGVNVIAQNSPANGPQVGFFHVGWFPTYGSDPSVRHFVRALVTAYNDRFFRPYT